jgi:hypothetical protein
MGSMTRDDLNKQGQLAVVVIGFFSAVQILAVQTTLGESAPRAALTLVIAVALAVRYWWAILLLPWPFHWFRLVLLLLAWVLPSFSAHLVADAWRWILSLAALSAVGCLTEVFGWSTEQWKVGSREMTRALKREHVSGAIGAGLVAVTLFVAGSIWTSPALEWVVLTLAVVDWIRLVLTIRRYEGMHMENVAT